MFATFFKQLGTVSIAHELLVVSFLFVYSCTLCISSVRRNLRLILVPCMLKQGHLIITCMDWKPPRNVILLIVAILVAPRSHPFRTNEGFSEVVLALE